MIAALVTFVSVGSYDVVRAVGPELRSPALNTRTVPQGVVGVPLQGAEQVASVLALLEPYRDSPPARWGLIYPPETAPHLMTYIRYQLAYAAYPHRIEVADLHSANPGANPAGFILAPGVGLRGSPPATGVAGGFRLYAAAIR